VFERAQKILVHCAVTFELRKPRDIGRSLDLGFCYLRFLLMQNLRKLKDEDYLRLKVQIKFYFTYIISFPNHISKNF